MPIVFMLQDYKISYSIPIKNAALSFKDISLLVRYKFLGYLKEIKYQFYERRIQEKDQYSPYLLFLHLSLSSLIHTSK